MQIIHERFIILRLFCNMMTKKGKKAKAEKILFNTIVYLRSKYRISSPANYILAVLGKNKPVLGLMSKQVAASKIRLPKKINIRQRYSKIMRWILIAAKKRNPSGYLTSQNLAKELYETGQKNSYTYTKKQIREHKTALYDTRAFFRYLR
jgi:small subunit ribosomal protein S7